MVFRSTRLGRGHPQDMVIHGVGAAIVAVTMLGGLSVVIGHAASREIVTIAGDGTAGYNGDSGPATRVELKAPSAVRVAPNGDIYIADGGNVVVRMIDHRSNNVIERIAGYPGSSAGSEGDGGPAINAQFGAVNGLAVDGHGDVYISDYAKVRKIDDKGIITTVAGDGLGNESPGSDDGKDARTVGVYLPQGLAVDAVGDLYIAEWYSGRVRKVDAHGIITTVAGIGGPVCAAIDTDPAGPGYTPCNVPGHLGDGGPATSAVLNYPMGVAVAKDGTLYIADSGNNCIRRVAPDGTITTVAGLGMGAEKGWTGGYWGDGGPATQAGLWDPVDVSVDAAGDLFIADQTNNRIREVDAKTQIINTVAGSGAPYLGGYGGDGGDPTAATLFYTESVDVDGTGNLYIADMNNNRIRRVENGGGHLTWSPATAPPVRARDLGAAMELVDTATVVRWRQRAW